MQKMQLFCLFWETVLPFFGSSCNLKANNSVPRQATRRVRHLEKQRTHWENIKTSIVLIHFPSFSYCRKLDHFQRIIYYMSLVSPFFGASFLPEMPLLKFMTVPLPWVLTNVHALGGGGATDFLGGGCVGQRHEIHRKSWGVEKGKISSRQQTWRNSNRGCAQLPCLD